MSQLFQRITATRVLHTAFVLFLFCFFSINSVHANATKPDVRVLIDVSGSMKRNDPKNLREPAVELLVKLLPEGSKAGVWTFGQKVKSLIPHQTVTKKWRKKATRQAKKIPSNELYTDIGAALTASSKGIDNLPEGHRTSIILLTDGVVDIAKDPAKNEKAKRKILDKLLPNATDASVAIHTIALSQNADLALLERLSMGTDGIAAVAESADDLMKVFLQAFDEAAPADQVPLKDNRFVVDSSVEEFTLLAFREKGGAPTRLIGPDDKVYSKANTGDANWFAADNYDLVTIKQPLEGEWLLKGDIAPDTRVTIVSDLSLSVNRLPKNVFPGNIPKMVAQLLEEGKVIDRTDFLQLMELTVEVKGVDSNRKWRKSLTKGKPVPSDATYPVPLSMLKEAGRYEVNIEVDGKTFQRKAKQLITVRDAFSVTLSESVVAEKPAMNIALYAREPDLDYSKTQAMATIKTPSGRNQIKGLVKQEERNWNLDFKGINEPGAYQVAVVITGQYEDGSDFNITLPEEIFGYKMDQAPKKPQLTKEPEPQAIPEPKPAEAPSAPAAPAAPVEPEEFAPEPEVAEEESGIPNWVIYTAVGAGNLLVMGIGFLLYRRFRNNTKTEALVDKEDSAEINLEGSTPEVSAAKSEADLPLDPEKQEPAEKEQKTTPEPEESSSDPESDEQEQGEDDALSPDEFNIGDIAAAVAVDTEPEAETTSDGDSAEDMLADFANDLIDGDSDKK